MSTPDRYVLATGEEARARLEAVHAVHGADTEAFLVRAGIGPSMRVADIGCGIGTISCWMAEAVGAGGCVVGIDVSEGQVEQARARAERNGLDNATFRVASAYDTGLESSSFDLVFCRFVLMHLSKPKEAVTEMARLVRPGGVLACEDGDFTSPFASPPSAAYDRCFELYRAAVAARGADSLVGPKMYRMVLNAGLRDPRVTLAQAVFTLGDPKRLPEWTLAECAPALIEHGITDREEIARLVGELKALAEDETTFFAMVQVTQVCARK
jgi:ubiquinone/menaquinone biosynthesis C-methylase UbiE